jgi:hypothetical protein
MNLFSGIKCDNKSCGFKDDTVVIEDYPAWVDRPCPKCGLNLLTKKDYENVQLLVRLNNSRIWKAINVFGNFINLVGKPFGVKPRQYKPELDGSGKIRFKEVPK